MLIVTGHPRPRRFETEIINFEEDSKTCLNTLIHPLEVGYATGSILMNTPVICGGFEGNRTNRCYKLIDNDFVHFANMTHVRSSVASVPINNGTILWVTGGYSEKFSDQKTTGE